MTPPRRPPASTPGCTACLHPSVFHIICPSRLTSILLSSLYISLSSCQSLYYLSISPFLRLLSIFPALRNHGRDPCGDICSDKMSLARTRPHADALINTVRLRGAPAHKCTHACVSKKAVFVLIKRQAGSKMNCNDFQAVLMANKSWIRKLTRTPSLSHTQAPTHTNTPTQGHVSWHAVPGSFRSQMDKVLSCFLLLMTVVLTFIITAWKGISRNYHARII